MQSVKRLMPIPSQSFFLFGPRGTGKSTLLHQDFATAIFVDLLNPDVYHEYLAGPGRLGAVVEGDGTIRTVVIDEVQRVPEILTEVHRLIELHRRRSVQFILTGSSSRKLKRAGTDLLAGRAIVRTLHPFMAAELGPRFDLRQSLQLGMLPLVLGANDPRATLDAYISLYLREEVQSEGLVRNVGSFARFLDAMSFSHASVLNISQVSRECQVSRQTAEGFVEILEDLLLGFRLRVFSRRAQRLLVGHPKFYYMDCGVFRSIRPKGPLDSAEEIGGGALEGLVAQHLRAWIAYSKADRTLHFWRTKSGVEVDFVVYGESTFLAIEVKRSQSVYNKDVKPLVSFLEEYPQAKACLLYGGKERLRINGVLCMPVEEFLLNLVPNSPAPVE